MPKKAEAASAAPESKRILSLDLQAKRVKIAAFDLESPIVFEFFSKVPSDDRDEVFTRAVYIGVLALMEDRLSTFFARTTNELGTHLESLKYLFEMKREVFLKSTQKGAMAESDISVFLEQYFKDKEWKDTVRLTGTEPGAIPRNKTGDLICAVDGDENRRIAIEVKLDKGKKIGDVTDRDVDKNRADSAWSQLIEARANRGAPAAIIVHDVAMCEPSILKFADGHVGYIPNVGFVAVVDSQRGDYTSLVIAYKLARDIVLNARKVDLDEKLLAVIVKRIIKDMSLFLDIKELVEHNIAHNEAILKQLDKGLVSMQFNQDYLDKFLKDGTLTEKDYLDYFMGSELKDRFKALQIKQAGE